MKFALAPIIVLFFAVASEAQSRPITVEEYDKAFKFAVSETNEAFPFLFTVVTEVIENGKVVRTVTEVDERESQERERITRTTVTGAKTTSNYQIRVDFDNVFCSDDGVTWKPPSPYECSSPVSFYGPRNIESVEYSVEQRSLAGKKVKVYREYSVFAPLKPNGKKDFRETVSTIDSRGFFINVVDTEGTLDPTTVTLIRRQSWDTNAKIKPVVAPIK